MTNEQKLVQRMIALGLVSFRSESQPQRQTFAPEERDARNRLRQREYRVKNLEKVKFWQRSFRLRRSGKNSLRPYTATGIQASATQQHNEYHALYMRLWRARKKQNHN